MGKHIYPRPFPLRSVHGLFFFLSLNKESEITITNIHTNVPHIHFYNSPIRSLTVPTTTTTHHIFLYHQRLSNGKLPFIFPPTHTPCRACLQSTFLPARFPSSTTTTAEQTRSRSYNKYHRYLRTQKHPHLTRPALRSFAAGKQPL